MSITPWTDSAFVHAVEAAWREVSQSDDLEPSSAAGAGMAQAILRSNGYPQARIIDKRSVTEALHHVAHWEVVDDATDV